MSYLTFKRCDLPVGRTTQVVFMNVAEDLLREFYKPTAFYDGFYNPFRSSKPQRRWVKPRYPSTSLQRITVDTFGDAFLHRKDSSSWGWHPDYISRLRRHLKGSKIPVIGLATWLFRDLTLPSRRADEWLIDRFLEAFRISPEELEALFDSSTDTFNQQELRDDRCREEELLEIIGHPPGLSNPNGLILSNLVINNVGPSRMVRYEPQRRLNLITGDNSLGKTFLLDCLWWSITGHWMDAPATPITGDRARQPSILACLTNGRRISEVEGRYSTRTFKWSRVSTSEAVAPLTVYARYDGSFAVWDPVSHVATSPDAPVAPMQLSREEVWNGKMVGTSGRDGWLCNGLVRDWMTWQQGTERYGLHFETLVAALAKLSPSAVEPLTPGKPTRVPRDVRDIPTLTMAYGDVPITHASAGVRRVIGLAYLMVWTWHEHLAACKLGLRPASKQIIIIIDEVEAHLHPRWQRVIVPSLMQVVRVLSPDVSPQVHLATHSPIVLASAEPLFDDDQDGLHHLDYREKEVILERLPFIRRGKVDAWLTSKAFGLRHARSVEGEQALEAAKALQVKPSPILSDIKAVHEKLRASLAPDDEFWPRWLYFAETHGVEL